MTGDKVISALIGLVGAVSNNGRTEQTDEVIREAFLHLREPDRDEDMVRQIHAAKNVIAPDCAVCKNPCGNTSDYDMTQFYGADEKVVGAKQKLIETICGVMKESGEMTDFRCSRRSVKSCNRKFKRSTNNTKYFVKKS